MSKQTKAKTAVNKAANSKVVTPTASSKEQVPRQDTPLTLGEAAVAHAIACYLGQTSALSRVEPFVGPVLLTALTRYAGEMGKTQGRLPKPNYSILWKKITNGELRATRIGHQLAIDIEDVPAALVMLGLLPEKTTPPQPRRGAAPAVATF